MQTSHPETCPVENAFVWHSVKQSANSSVRTPPNASKTQEFTLTTRQAMNLKPLHDRLIVRPATPEEVTKGGIILPDTAKEKPVQGEVLAVGPGKLDENGKIVSMGVKVGDTVLYGKYSGT